MGIKKTIKKSKKKQDLTSFYFSKKLNKKLVISLMKTKGEIRGIDIKSDGDFIVKEKGQVGLEKVENELKNIGCPIEYQKIERINFYPAGLKIVSLLAAKEVLGFDEKKIEEMGAFAMKLSFIVKVFSKHFNLFSKFFFKEAPNIWKKYWTAGEFVPVEYNEEKKFVIFKISGLNLHPLYCSYLRGYFSVFTRTVTGGQKINCQEIKCFFRGDKDHEFLIKWE